MPSPVEHNPAAPRIIAATGGTKLEACIAIHAANKHLSRGEMIELFMTSARMTKAGASTYYAKINAQSR
jgi:hypothetical protein